MNNISRRAFLKAAGLGTLSVTFGGCLKGALTSKPSKRPNVLFFFADQLRADACSVYGGKNISTPNIDKLASEGIRFTNGLSTTPLCTPYRGMVQTGRLYRLPRI